MSEYVVVGPHNGTFGVYTRKHQALRVALNQRIKSGHDYTIREVPEP